MGSDRTVMGRLREVDRGAVDWVLAVLLTVGALADAASQPHRALGVLAVVPLIAFTTSVGWRRRDPVLATLIAITALIAFQRASAYAGDGSVEVAVIALNFYTLGRCARGRGRTFVPAVMFAYWLVGDVVIAYSQAGGSVGAVIGTWILFGGLPYAVGRTLMTRSALTRELEAGAVQLEGEQHVRSQHAAGEERNRMARELHDVIAHSVSVMVIQTSAARRVARGDLEAAMTALEVVEGAGRDALVELRRIVGVLRRGSDSLAGSAAPGLSQLDALVDRARVSGLPVEVCVEGRPATLSPGLDLVAYRVVQEALTNVIKHAGPVPTDVKVTFGAHEVALEVSDTGHRRASDGEDRDGPGHGLVGMGERVALYGGQLSAGPRAGGGFDVRARIPFDARGSSPQVLGSPAGGHSVIAATAEEARWPWLEPILAGAFGAVFDVEVLTSSHRRGPLVLNLLAVAGMALAVNWRRRSPLLFFGVVAVLAAVMSQALTSLNNLPLVAIYFLLVPTYSVAAWKDGRKAALALAVYLGGSAVSAVIIRHQTVGNFAGAAFLLCAAWATGRAIRTRRLQTRKLKQTSARLTAEREDCARLAVAGERSRIARELHAVVARSVAAMVVQAEAARALLDRDPARADTVMDAIESTGREVLAEMRRILGVLRRTDEAGEREPQPGIAQIYTLIQHARERGQPVELSVDGEPGTLPAGVDLGIYRILEEALQSARRVPGSAVGVALRFGEEDLELHLTARCHGPSGWPTDAMRERVALCGGALSADAHDEDGWHIIARMPRGLQGALA